MSKLKDWVKDQYELEEMRDILNHGCVSGAAHGAIYYRETVALYDQFSNEIWDILYNDAESQGLSIISMLAQFNGQKDVGSDEQFKNMLVWYAIEETCRSIIEGEDE